MKYLAVILLVALVHCAAAEGTEETKPAANQPAYQAAYQPYPYRSYSGYDTYRSRYGSYDQYPSSNYDLGSQHLHLSGGIYRPYDYADDYAVQGGYKPYTYDNAYKYYGNSATRYVRYPHNTATNY